MSDKSERLLKIYSLLKRGPLTVELLNQWAERHGIQISPRTFYRDLKDLENSLFIEGEKLVVTTGEKNKKVWKIEYQNSHKGLLDFDISSYILFKNFLPLPVVSARRASLDKMVELFYKSYSKSKFEQFAELGDKQIVGTHFYEVSVMENYQKILDDCLWSIQNKREMEVLEIEFDYTSNPKHIHSPVRFLPMQLLYHRGVVHVVGFVKGDVELELVVLALEQFKRYQLTNDMFNSTKLEATLKKKMLRRFGITKNTDNKIYKVELEFSRLTGAFIRNQFWHETQAFEELENGNVILRMNCGLNRELTGWIFQWMSNVKVIGPPELKEMYLKKLKDIEESYNSDAPLESNNSFRPD